MKSAARVATTSLRAVRVLRNVVEKSWKLEAAWKHETQSLPKHESQLLRDVSSGTLRHLHEYSRLIDYCAPSHQLTDDVVLRLLAASTLYQIHHSERSPSTAVLSQGATQCCAPLERPWASRFLSAMFHTLSQLSERELRDTHTSASRLSLPEWLYERLRADDRHALAKYGPILLQRPDSLCVCVPKDRERYVRRLRAAGFRASASEFAPFAVHLHARPRDVEGALPGLSERAVHVQDAVQQYGPGLLRKMAPGDRVLDACAAPGGKSLALLAHQPTISLVALDKNPRKVRGLREALSRVRARRGAGVQADATTAHGAHGMSPSVLCADAADVDTWWDGRRFSAIIVDPPCTATGLMRALPEVKVHRTAADLSPLNELQLRLLRSLWPLLEQGGELLYSTCSILACENDGVIGAFVREMGDARPSRLSRPQGAMCASRPHGGLVFYPSERHQGGFVALIRKSSCRDILGDRGSPLTTQRMRATNKSQDQDRSNSVPRALRRARRRVRSKPHWSPNF